MANWTAIFGMKVKDLNSGNIVCPISYATDDGLQSLTPPSLTAFNLTDDVIKAHAARVIASLTTRDAAFDAITLVAGPLDISNVTLADNSDAIANAALNTALQNINAATVIANAKNAGVAIPDGVEDAVNANLATAGTSFTAAQATVATKLAGTAQPAKQVG